MTGEQQPWDVKSLTVAHHGFDILTGLGYKTLNSGNSVLVWCEAGRQDYRLRIQILDAQFRAVARTEEISLQRGHTVFAVAAMESGGFVIAWNEARLIKIRHCHDDGTINFTKAIGQTSSQIDRIQLAVLPNDEIGIDCREFFSIQNESDLTLCAVWCDAWHSTIAKLKGGDLVRIIMQSGHGSYHGAPPIYSFKGSIFAKAGTLLGEFHLNVPTTIVKNMYSHPDHTVIAALTNAGFVLVWTQHGHHFGNSIRAQIFAEDGASVGETFTVAVASQAESVNNPVIISAADGGFLIAWSLNDDPDLLYQAQFFSNDGAKIGSQFGIGNYAGEDRSSLCLATNIANEIVALWSENNEIKICQLAQIGGYDSSKGGITD